MKTHYQLSTSDFAINGIIAVSMSDEIRKQLEGKAQFLDEKSKEVQAYLAEVAKRQTEDLAKAEAAQALADEKEDLAQIVKDYFTKPLAERVAARKAKREAERQSEAKLAEG